MYQLNLLQNPNSSEKQKNIYQHVPVSTTAILFLAVPCSFGRNVDPSTRDGSMTIIPFHFLVRPVQLTIVLEIDFRMTYPATLIELYKPKVRCFLIFCSFQLI